MFLVSGIPSDDTSDVHGLMMFPLPDTGLYNFKIDINSDSSYQEVDYSNNSIELQFRVSVDSVSLYINPVKYKESLN